VDGTRDAKANGPTTELVSSALKLDLLPVIPSSEKTTTVYSVAQTRNLGVIVDAIFFITSFIQAITKPCEFDLLKAFKLDSSFPPLLPLS